MRYLSLLATGYVLQLEPSTDDCCRLLNKKPWDTILKWRNRNKSSHIHTFTVIELHVHVHNSLVQTGHSLVCHLLCYQLENIDDTSLCSPPVDKERGGIEEREGERWEEREDVSHSLWTVQYHNKSQSIITYHFIGNHDDEVDSLLPHHLPEISTSVFQRALGHDVAILPSAYSELQANSKYSIWFSYTCTCTT